MLPSMIRACLNRFRRVRCKSLLVALLFPMSLWAAPSSSGGDTKYSYPSARRDEVMNDYNGIKVADPYRWLEQLDSPETRAWILAEAQLTDSYLEKLPVRRKLRERLTALQNFEKYGVPFHAGDRYFYTHNSGLQ